MRKVVTKMIKVFRLSTSMSDRINFDAIVRAYGAKSAYYAAVDGVDATELTEEIIERYFNDEVEVDDIAKSRARFHVAFRAGWESAW